jgi:F-type H+-transporting ATPase subunit delta
MKISKEARLTAKELFRNSFTDGRLDPAKISIVARKIASSKPRHYLAMLKEYQRLARLEVEKHHAVVESASALDARTSEQLGQTLRAKYGSDLTTEFKVTPELIGGLRVKLGSNVWDGSVRNRLDRLGSELAQS